MESRRPNEESQKKSVLLLTSNLRLTSISLTCTESKNLSPLLSIHYFSAFGTYLYITDLKKNFNMTTETLLEQNAELCTLQLACW